MYYRNVAMLSRKVMRGIGLPTDVQEDGNIPPLQETATELAKYFNGIISNLILEAGVTQHSHLEIALSNIGDALGGISRNEVGRYAAAEILHYLIIHWHNLGYLHSIYYSFKPNFQIEEETEESHFNGTQRVLTINPQIDVPEFLKIAESNRVKYQEIVLNNGYHLLLDRQITWHEQTSEGRSYRIGPDLVSKTVSIDMAWAGEIKGGADPAGSDEHWKTATQALNRILEAAEKTGKPQPQLSFLATILVDRVAIEAQRWIDDGKLTSVYNLTKIADSAEELQRFLDDMTRFLGYY